MNPWGICYDSGELMACQWKSIDASGKKFHAGMWSAVVGLAGIGLTHFRPYIRTSTGGGRSEIPRSVRAPSTDNISSNVPSLTIYHSDCNFMGSKEFVKYKKAANDQLNVIMLHPKVNLFVSLTF